MLQKSKAYIETVGLDKEEDNFDENDFSAISDSILDASAEIVKEQEIKLEFQKEDGEKAATSFTDPASQIYIDLASQLAFDIFSFLSARKSFNFTEG